MAFSAFVGLGANLGDPAATLDAAIAALAGLPGTVVPRSSSFYRTAPIDATGPEFLNAVAELQTCLEPERLLEHLFDIEREHGRKRPYRNAPRTLDLDLLLVIDRRAGRSIVIDTPGLMLPHPRMHERAFVLAPLVEIAPDAVIPGRGPAAALLPAVLDQRIEKVST